MSKLLLFKGYDKCLLNQVMLKMNDWLKKSTALSNSQMSVVSVIKLSHNVWKS